MTFSEGTAWIPDKDVRCLACQRPPCDQPADTVRKFQAAPDLCILVPLCYLHQHIWDEVGKFEGPKIFKEPPCDRESKFEQESERASG